MNLYFKDVTFSVSGVPGSRKPDDQLHFCVDMVFATEEDLESHAVAQGRVDTQALIRKDIDIRSGKTDRPNGYKDYSLKPVAKGILPEGTKLTANATVNHKGVVQPTLEEQLDEGVATLKALLTQKLAADPKTDMTKIQSILKLMEGNSSK